MQWVFCNCGNQSFKTSINLTMFLECDCRCQDANLINVPVLVGRLDRSFYRVAFFTTREVHPREELTWDYGIDFLQEDADLPVFACKCGSEYCRDSRRK